MRDLRTACVGMKSTNWEEQKQSSKRLCSKPNHPAKPVLEGFSYLLLCFRGVRQSRYSCLSVNLRQDGVEHLHWSARAGIPLVFLPQVYIPANCNAHMYAN